MKKYKQIIAGLATALAELAVGVLLLIRPEGFTTAIIQVLGALLMLGGLWQTIGYFRKPAAEAAKSQLLAKGLAALALGVFCMFNAGWLIAAFPVLAMLYGVVMLAAGFGKVQAAADLFRMKRSRWYMAAIGAGVTLVGAAVILSNPIGTAAALWVFTGVTLIVEAVLDAAAVIMNREEKKEA